VEHTCENCTLTPVAEFQVFPKIARLSRDIVVTEKIDGTNAVVYVDDQSDIVLAGSRSRWLSPVKSQDNFGFATWVAEHERELREGLGPGYHYGEWWGRGIQRGYGLDEKRFSLFNTSRWTDDVRPKCCHVVPVLYTGPFETTLIDGWLLSLQCWGSKAAPGFDKPEGVVIYHRASGALFKKTIEGDAAPKGQQA